MVGESGISLIASIQGKIDEAQIKEEAKKAGSIFENIKLGAKNFGKGYKAGILGKTAEARTGAGALGMTAARSTLALGVLVGIGYGVKKMVGFLASSSGYLKATLGIMSRSYAIFWRPFGDALAVLMFPMARAMLKFATWFLRTTKEKGGGFGAILDTLVIDLPEKFGSWMWGQLTGLFGLDNLSPLEGWGAWFLGVLAVPALFKFAPMIRLGAWLIGILTKTAKWGIDKVLNLGKWFKGVVGKTAFWGLNITFDLGKWLLNKAKSIFKGWGGGGGGGLISSIVDRVTGGGNAGAGGGSPSPFRGGSGGMGGMWRDFISRPGQGIQTFSPDDTVIGIKSGSLGGLGGGSSNVTVNVYIGNKEITDIVRTEIEEDRWRRGVLS